MARLVRYIKVEDAIKVADEECGEFRGIFGRIKERLEGMPTTDTVEVVTCKDCVFLEVLNSEHYYARCKWHGRLFPSFGNPDTRYYFCADCQGREDNDEIH